MNKLNKFQATITLSLLAAIVLCGATGEPTKWAGTGGGWFVGPLRVDGAQTQTGNAAFGGTVAVTGTSTFTGRTTHNGGATIAGTLLFSTDNTRDIGASGATRARDLFLGRNADIAGTLAVTGAQTFTGASNHAAVINADSAGTGLAVDNNATIGGTIAVTGASTLTGAVSCAAAGTGLAVTNNATVGGTLNVTGATQQTGALTIGSGGASIAKVLRGSASLNFGSIATLSSADLTITVTGAVAGDVVDLGSPATLDAGIVPYAFVTSANTVTVRASNITVGSIDPADSTFKVVIVQ